MISMKEHKLIFKFWVEAILNNVELAGYTTKKLAFLSIFLLNVRDKQKRALIDAAMEDLLLNSPAARVKALRAIRDYVKPSDEELDEFQQEALESLNIEDMFEA